MDAATGKGGVVGEDYSFSQKERVAAQSVTNHIYNSNVGVIGAVDGNNSMSKFSVTETGIKTDELLSLAQQIRDAMPGLPKDVAGALRQPLTDFEEAAKSKTRTRVNAAVNSMKEVLSGSIR
jgi:hypothetical protein